MDEVVRDKVGAERAAQPEAQPEPSAEASQPDLALAAELMTEKNTFLDCRSPWSDPVDLPQRPRSWPPDRPSSYPGGYTDTTFSAPSSSAAAVAQGPGQAEESASRSPAAERASRPSSQAPLDAQPGNPCSPASLPRELLGRCGGGLGRMQRTSETGPCAAELPEVSAVPEVAASQKSQKQESQKCRQHKKLHAPDLEYGWHRDGAATPQRVKMYMVAFDVIAGSGLENKVLKDLPPCFRCLRVLRMLDDAKHLHHHPMADVQIKAGFRVFAMFERPRRSPYGWNVVQVPSGIDVNTHLYGEIIPGLFVLGDNNTLQLAYPPDEWFDVAVSELRLSDPAADLKLERFDCLQVSYPLGADAGWVGAPIGIWRKGSRNAGFPSRRDITQVLADVPPELRGKLRALNWRYNFKGLPLIVAVLRKEIVDENTTLWKYVVPPLASTIIQSGDIILFLPTSDLESPSQNKLTDVLSKPAQQLIVAKLNKEYINNLDRYDKE